MQATITLGPFMRFYLLLITTKRGNYGASNLFHPQYQRRCSCRIVQTPSSSRNAPLSTALRSATC